MQKQEIEFILTPYEIWHIEFRTDLNIKVMLKDVFLLKIKLNEIAKNK